MDCINDGFKLFFESFTEECLLQRQVPEVYYSKPCGKFFVHDFNEWEPVSVQIPRVVDLYRRRISRFLEDIKEPTLFMYYLYEEDDVEYINNYYEDVIKSLKSFNNDNKLLLVSDEKYRVKVPCYYVKNDVGIDISYNFSNQNKELFNFLDTLPYPTEQRARNLAFYKKKLKHKTYYKIKKKIRKFWNVKVHGIYHHRYTWFD